MAATSIALTFPGIHILEQTPGTLRPLLTNATKEDLDWQPSPERWSISMVLAHLADVEQNGFVSRFRAIAGLNAPDGLRALGSLRANGYHNNTA